MRFRQLAAVAPLIIGLALALPVAAQDKPAAPAAAADSTAEAPARPEKQKRHRVKKVVKPVERSAYMFGLGYGAGSAEVKVDGQGPDREIGPGTNVRVGFAVRPTAVVGVEMSQWESAPDSSVWTFRTFTPSVTFYPTIPGVGKGFFFRLGAGYGVVRTRFTFPITRYDSLTAKTVADTLYQSISDDGFAATGALGYEWRRGKHFAIGPQAEVAYITAGPGRSANFANVTITLNWYW